MAHPEEEAEHQPLKRSLEDSAGTRSLPPAQNRPDPLTSLQAYSQCARDEEGGGDILLDWAAFERRR